MFEEGIRILPTRLIREGEWNSAVTDIIAGNVRLPRQVLGDLEAQVVSNEVSVRRVGEFLTDTGLTNLQGLSAELHARTDRAMRRAIAAVPDGTYRSVIEADGFDERTTRIVCAVTVSGETMHIDYEGTSPQIDRGINCVLNYTHAYSVYPVKCALDPFTPRNEGSYRAITVQRTGEIDPQSGVSGALQRKAVDRPSARRRDLSRCWNPCCRTRSSPTAAVRRRCARCSAALIARAIAFSQVLFASGGMGAAPHKDGLPTTAFPTNVGAGSIEAYESVAPLLVWKKRLRTDSGGAGTFRGGLGQVVEIEVRTEQPVRLSLLSDRHQHPPYGVRGGMHGGPSVITLDNGDKPHPKSRTSVDAGRRVTLLYAGGGGYGDPRARESGRL